MPLRNRSGFTLIELLVVTAIIGVLASLAVSNFFFAKRNAQNASAAAAMRNLLPALDFASSQEPAPDLVAVAFGPDAGTLSGALGAAMPEARNADGVIGHITVQKNRYRIEAAHVNGTICYIYDSQNAPTYSAVEASSCA